MNFHRMKCNKIHSNISIWCVFDGSKMPSVKNKTNNLEPYLLARAVRWTALASHPNNRQRRKKSLNLVFVFVSEPGRCHSVAHRPISDPLLWLIWTYDCHFTWLLFRVFVLASIKEKRKKKKTTSNNIKTGRKRLFRRAQEKG